jgi:hypothetical protein
MRWAVLSCCVLLVGGNEASFFNDDISYNIHSVIFCHSVRHYYCRPVLYLTYLLTAVVLSPGGSTHLHTNST